MPCFLSTQEMSLSVSNEKETRVCEGYRLLTLSEHGASGQVASIMTLEKPGRRARTDSLPPVSLSHIPAPL